MSKPEPYNPLDKNNLGESVAQALLRVPVRKLSDLDGLIGAGIYAIYYTGDYPSYAPIKEKNANEAFECPIYIGKAIPSGGRKGGMREDASAVGTPLRGRLRNHASSIEKGGLPISDFHYRALVVDDVWIPLGENVLIDKFQPLWNRVIDGFGNKTPGKGRKDQKFSSWDVLHPGRYTHLNLKSHGLGEEKITEKITLFFNGTLPESEKISVDTEASDEA